MTKSGDGVWHLLADAEYQVCAMEIVFLSWRCVKCWDFNSMGTKGYVKEGLELTPMGSFDVEQGGH